LADDELTYACFLDVLREEESELGRDTAVLVARRLVDDEDAAHELDAFVGNVRVKQLLGGHEGSGHVENVGSLGGHGKKLASSCHRTCNKSGELLGCLTIFVKFTIHTSRSLDKLGTTPVPSL
jgi:hypothetical protein